MFDTLYDTFMKGSVVLVICTAILMRTAMKNPRASGGIAKFIFGLFRK